MCVICVRVSLRVCRQGLEFHAGFLWESTGMEQRSSVRKVEATTGKVLQSTLLTNPRKFGVCGVCVCVGVAACVRVCWCGCVCVRVIVPQGRALRVWATRL